MSELTTDRVVALPAELFRLLRMRLAAEIVRPRAPISRSARSSAGTAWTSRSART